MGVCAFSMLLATGCSNEELVEQIEQQQYTLEVGVGKNSRTYNDENGECNWGENEQIYVFSEDRTVSSVLTLLSKNGNTATFAGTVSGDPAKLKYTIYPVPNKDGKIEMKTIDGNNHNAPMYGSIEGGGAKLSFAGGVVKLDINGAGEGVFKAEGTKGVGSVTGGHYTFNNETKKLEFVPGTSSVVEIKNIPDDGVVFLPVATEADLSENQKDVVTLTLTTPEGQTITENVEVAQGASTQSEENAFPSVNYDSTNGGLVKAKIEDLEGLEKALEVGGEYELVKDITASTILKIRKGITIIGNNKTVTSTDSYVFEIMTSEINVEMNKLNIVNKSEKASGNNSYLAGIKIDPDLQGVGLTLESCSVSFDNEENGTDWAYAVNVAGGTSNCGITINGGSYEGANVVNVHGTGHEIQIEGTTLTSLYQPNELYYGVCIKLYANGNSVIKNDNKYYGDNAVDFWWPGGNISITGGGDENYTKKVIAKVGEEWCYSLEEAATKRGDIYLFGDVTLNSNVVLNSTLNIAAEKEVTLNLNKKTLTANNCDAITGVGSDIVLKIKNGNIKVVGEKCCAVYLNKDASNAEVILEDLVIVEEQGAIEDGFAPIYKNGGADNLVLTLERCKLSWIYISDDFDTETKNVVNVNNSVLETVDGNCIEILNTDLTVNNTELINLMKSQSATIPGQNIGNNYATVAGYCIAAYNKGDQKALGSISLDDDGDEIHNVYTLATPEGKIAFYQGHTNEVSGIDGGKITNNLTVLENN